MDRQNIIISFIIPAYNVEDYLGKCLDSILSQTDNRHEIIIIDDGSIDRTGAIADSYAERDNTVKVIHTPNRGVSCARNTGLDNAHGEWIWFVDSDDCLLPEAIDSTEKYLRNRNCDVVFNGLIEGESPDNYKMAHTTEKADAVNISGYLDHNMAYQNGMVIFRHSVIRDNSLRFTPGMIMAEDLEFQYKALAHSSKCSATGTPCYLYRTRQGSAVMSTESIRLKATGGIEAARHIINHISENGLTFDRWICLRINLLLKSSINAAMRGPIHFRNKIRQEIKELLAELPAGLNRGEITTLAVSTFMVSPFLLKLLRSIR